MTRIDRAEVNEDKSEKVEVEREDCSVNKQNTTTVSTYMASHVIPGLAFSSLKHLISHFLLLLHRFAS